MVTIEKFITQVWEAEGISLQIYAAQDGFADDYKYIRANDNWTVGEWIRRRVSKYVILDNVTVYKHGDSFARWDELIRDVRYPHFKKYQLLDGSVI
jgi:hypothetical protein